MKKIIIVIVLICAVVSCKQEENAPMEWVLMKTISLDGVNPIGITAVDGKIWLSDGDHNRLVQIDEMGKIEKTIDSLDRPMHIDAWKKTIYVPEYGIDAISMVYADDSIAVQVGHGGSRIVIGTDKLDAPAGVSVMNKEVAIADFYNNRILYNGGTGWISFGKEGKAEGEFYYPTDVQITADKIWVADAYNNRIQVFDKEGNFLQMMGQDQKINAATGIYVSDDTVFITDFENDRILVFDMDGNLIQTLRDKIEKPTDMIVMDNLLYVINYRNGRLNQYGLGELKAKY